jgi:hypothetical protein
VTAEKALFPSLANGGAKIVETFGYSGGSEVPVFSKTYTTDGTYAIGAGSIPPGDVVCLVRYSTADRSSKNHPIYLFSYYHATVFVPGGGTFDVPAAGVVTAMGTYAAAWIAGFSDGSVTHKRSRPNENVATGYVVETYLTHRDLPR